MSRNSPELREENNVLSVTDTRVPDCDLYNKYNLNRTNGNVEITLQTETLTVPTADQVNCNSTIPADSINTKTIKYEVDTGDLVVLDNTTSNIIKIENLKKTQPHHDIIIENFNCSTNSLNSDNLSSPMQTSADMFLDSEILSTDVASNDSQSPKNLQVNMKTFNFREDGKGFAKQEKYESNDSLSQIKSDHSLLNSEESSDSSPVHKVNRDYKKVQRKHKKKYFGVKTLQSIFNKRDGYSDISSTASELVDELLELKKKSQSQNDDYLTKEDSEAAVYTCKAVYPDTSPQFEENIHNILSDIFVKSFTSPPEPNLSNLVLNKPTGNKKYFSLHGQNLRVGKALRLCPNEDYSEQIDQEQRKEKLLARYVYNANSISADGVGDPDFGTPV